jgi:carboxymethylenebutenolidase
MGHWVDLVAADGARIAAWRAEPAGAPRGALVVVQEIFGVNSHVRSVCEGCAADGYHALVPAWFNRIQPRVDLGYAPDDVERGRALKAKASLDCALADVEAARAVAASAGRVGIVGYCWGGYIAWMSASRLAGFARAVPSTTAGACWRHPASGRAARSPRMSANRMR